MSSFLIVRSYVPFRHTTLPEHMPESHRRYLEWTPSRIINWSAKSGPSTGALVKEIMERKPHPEQGFRLTKYYTMNTSSQSRG
jgi:transposase